MRIGEARNDVARGIADAIPFRGGLAANTVAGTISGWDTAFALSRNWGGRLPLKRLLADAIYYAEHGMAVTRSQAVATETKRAELESQPGFAATFLPGDKTPVEGMMFRQPRLAETLRRLSRGLTGFYRGRLARSMADDLAAAGSPLTVDDLSAHRAAVVAELQGSPGLIRLASRVTLSTFSDCVALGLRAEALTILRTARANLYGL